MKTSRHILLLCTLTLAATPALSARSYDDDSVVLDTTKAVALKDVALEKEPSTDAPLLKPRKSISLAKVAGVGAVLGMGILHMLTHEARKDPNLLQDSTVYSIFQVLAATSGAAFAAMSYFIADLID